MKWWGSTVLMGRDSALFQWSRFPAWFPHAALVTPAQDSRQPANKNNLGLLFPSVWRPTTFLRRQRRTWWHFLLSQGSSNWHHLKHSSDAALAPIDHLSRLQPVYATPQLIRRFDSEFNRKFAEKISVCLLHCFLLNSRSSGFEQRIINRYPMVRTPDQMATSHKNLSCFFACQLP